MMACSMWRRGLERRVGGDGHETYAVEVVARALAIEHARGGVVEKAGGEVCDAKHLHKHKSRPFSAASLTDKMLCSVSPCEAPNSFVCSARPIFIPRNAAQHVASFLGFKVHGAWGACNNGCPHARPFPFTPASLHSARCTDSICPSAMIQKLLSFQSQRQRNGLEKHTGPSCVAWCTPILI